MSYLSRSISFLALFGFSGALWAAVPDAGGILRDEQPVDPQLRKLPGKQSPQAPATAGQAGVTIQVKQFEFKGYEGLISETELQALVASSVGKPVGIAELQALVAEVTALLKKKGYFLARAYLPRQDVSSGTIEIAILQAKVDGDVRVNANSSRLSPTLVKNMTEGLVKPGQPLNEHDLERVLLLLNDLPGVAAKAVLEPGSTPGTTRVALNIEEGRLFSGSVWADNYGNRYTGSWRGNGLVSLNDPFGIGDQATVLVSGAEGLAQARVSYGMPFGSSGLRGNIAYTAMGYKLVGELKPLHAKGGAQTVAAWLSLPLIRSRSLNVGVTAGYDFKALRDEIADLTIRDKRIHSGNAGVNASWHDALLGGGYTSASAAATFGHVDLSGVKADERADRVTARTAGGYSRYNLSAARLQRVVGQLTAYAAYSGQFASGNLDSSEKMSLGGPYGVRAYPVGEASGDEAHLFSVELRHDLPLDLKWGAVQLSAFFDTGQVTLNKTLWPYAVQTLKGKNEYWLSGAGVGISLSEADRYFLRLNYAHKIGGNDGRTLQGNDSDGRDDDGRFWLIGQISL
jgi:hemolysin activation/secretion protein